MYASIMGELSGPILIYATILLLLSIAGTLYLAPKTDLLFLYSNSVTSSNLLPNHAQQSPSTESTTTTKSEQSAPSPPLEGYKLVKATIFWVGEGADESNAFIPNNVSAWQSAWQDNYGGVDDPADRCGFHPCQFTPKQNPFYFALPYNDLTAQGVRKTSAEKIPWFEEHAHKKSVVKNHWIELRHNSRVCYAQWEDVGPLETDDFEYVFGDRPPKNSWGVAAGIDLSPATFTCLGLTTNDIVSWKFIDEQQVPPGPWKDIITSTDVDWQSNL